MPTRQEGATYAAPVGRDHSRGPLGVSRSVHGGLEIMIEDPSAEELLKNLASLLAPTKSSSKIIAGNPHVSAFAGYEEGPPLRRLQETCAPGDAFTLSSSIYPDAEGCYNLIDAATNSYQVLGTDRVLWPVLVVFTPTSDSSITSTVEVVSRGGVISSSI